MRGPGQLEFRGPRGLCPSDSSGLSSCRAACLGKGRAAAGAHVILGGLGEAGGGGGLPAACRQGSQLCHCDSVAGGQGSSRAAVPTASSTGTIWARPCPVFPLGYSGLISNNFLLPQAGNTPPKPWPVGCFLDLGGGSGQHMESSWLSPLPAAPTTFLPTFLDLALPLAWGGLGLSADTSSQTFPRASFLGPVVCRPLSVTSR